MLSLLSRIEFLVQAFLPHRQFFCPHCGEADLQTVTRKLFFIKIQYCRKCFLYFTDPIYKTRLTRNFYNRFYSVGSVTDLPVEARLTPLREEGFRSIHKNFEYLIPPIGKLTTGRELLEVGSSWGYFLDQARSAGYRAVGVEISDVRRDYGRRYMDLDIRASVDEFEENAFDIVFSHHVLEHFTDISSIFIRCFKRLKKGGHLVIGVPNCDYQKYGKKVLPIIGAVHPIGFTSDFFKFTLPKYGFSNVRLFQTWGHVPDRPAEFCAEDGIIVVAQK